MDRPLSRRADGSGERGATGRRRSPVRRTLVLPIAALLVVAGLAGCGSTGGGTGGITHGTEYRASEDRLPGYTDPIRQISLRGGRLGWGGLEVGMSFRDVQLALGSRLPPPGEGMRQDEMCGTYWADVQLLRQKQKLRIEMGGGLGDSSRLQAIFLILESRAGDLSTLDVARALHGRFSDLEYVPSPHDQNVPESTNPKPLYRLAKTPDAGQLWVDPEKGVYFGKLCLD